MPNPENLIKLTSKKARKIGKLGGIKSGEAKRARKTLKETLLLLLKENKTQENITVALISKAINGDVKAFEVIRDTVGEKPEQGSKLTGDINIRWEGK